MSVLLTIILILVNGICSAADFSEIEVITNVHTPSLPTHQDYLLDIDNLSSDVITTGTISGITIKSSGYSLGSVIFSDGSQFTEDNSNFFWDLTNLRLGIGTTVPSAALDLNDQDIDDVGDIALDTISSDSGTNITVNLGTSAGDDFIVTLGGGGLFVLEGDKGGHVHVTGSAPLINLNSTVSALFEADRAATNRTAGMHTMTAGLLKWFIGTAADSTENFQIRDLIGTDITRFTIDTSGNADFHDGNVVTTGYFQAGNSLRLVPPSGDSWHFDVGDEGYSRWTNLSRPWTAIRAQGSGATGSVNMVPDFGKVGIGLGVTPPGYLLDVNGIGRFGTVRAETITDGTLTITGGDLTTPGTGTLGDILIGDVRLTQPTAGFLAARTDSPGTDTTFQSRGRGVGAGKAQFRSGGSQVIWTLGAFNTGTAGIDVAGSAPTKLSFIGNSTVPVQFYRGGIEDRTQYVGIYGFRTGDAERSIRLAVGIDAVDTASFYNIGNYYFDGNVGIETTSPDTTLQVVGISRFGEDITNYSEFESDGTLVFNGTATVFDDLRTPVNAVRVPSLKAPTWTAYNGTQLLGFSYQAVEGNEEEIYFTIQMTHGYKEGSDVVPHVHWIPNEDTTDDPEVVRWGLEYEWQNIGGTFAGSTTIHAEESMTDKSDDHIKTLFPAIDGTGKTISSMFTCRLFRNSSHENDTYDNGTALALFMEIDFHFEKDTVGSRLIDDSK